MTKPAHADSTAIAPHANGQPAALRSEAFQINRDVVAIEYRAVATTGPESADVIRVAEAGGPGEFRIVLAPEGA
jgi:hypothetical protein